MTGPRILFPPQEEDMLAYSFVYACIACVQNSGDITSCHTNYSTMAKLDTNPHQGIYFEVRYGKRSFTTASIEELLNIIGTVLQIYLYPTSQLSDCVILLFRYGPP